MNAENIRSMLALLGCARVTNKTAGWVSATCPFHWSHKNGDRNPSFGVAICNDSHSGYKCWGCGEEGDLVGLVFRLGKKSGKHLGQVMDFVKLHDTVSASAIRVKVEKSRSPMSRTPGMVGGIVAPIYAKQETMPFSVDDTIPEEALTVIRNTPIPTAVRTYLTDPKIPISERDPEQASPSRGLRPEVLREFEVCWDPKRKRIILPIRDLNGRLVSLTGRAFFKQQRPKFLHTEGFNKLWYLYGEHKARRGGTGYLVEGNFDVQMLWQLGYDSSVADMGSSIGPVQVEKLCTLFKEVVYIRDGDDAGKAAEKKIMKALFGHISAKSVAIKDEYDPDDLSREEAAELLGPPVGRTVWS